MISRFNSKLKIHFFTLAMLLSGNVLANETVQLQLRWHHQFQFAGYYAALEKGYYEKAGLDVKILEGSSEKSPVNEVLKNGVQYGVANSELLYERLHGAPLVALAAIFQHSPSVLLARKEILSPSDLIGKKVMMLNKSLDTDLLAMLSNEGVDISRVGILPSSFELQDLIDGRVDAYNAYLTNEAYFLKWQNFPFTIINPRNYGVDFYSDILFTTEDEIAQHPERVKAFRKATIEGWTYALEHPDEIIELLINKYYVEKSRRHLGYEAESVRPLIVPDLIEIGHMNPARWQNMADTFVKAGMVDKNAVDERLKNFVYDSDIKVDKERFQSYLSAALIFSVSGLFVLVLLLIAYKSIRRENKQRRKIAKALLRQSSDLALHNQILKQVGSNTIDLHTLHGLLAELIRGIEMQHPDMICSVMLLNRETGELHHGAAPSLPEVYNEAVDGLKIGDGAGSCGTAAFRGERVIVEDVLNHPYWKNYVELATLAGVRACWAQPILNSQNEVLGTIAVYHRSVTIPKQNELVSIEQYANLVMLMIERWRDDTKIQQLAFYDPLTGLPNRRLMAERLRYGIEYGSRENKHMAVLMMDLDKFKAVNDNFGHAAGDELLIQVAQRIQNRIRRDVDTVARLGGDEFIILLKDIAHVDDAARVAEFIVADLSLPFQLTQSDNVQIGASIGISLFPEHGSDSELLIDHADTALYHAKDAGRGCFAYFSEELTQAVRERIELETRLRRAIENKELRLYYQPQVEIESGKIIGTEALVRWLDPIEGLIPPNRFIPLAEETGLIEAIGEWVIYEACRQGKEWMDLGIKDLTIAVNVSPWQFRRSDITELVTNALRDTGFPANRLELELTESGLMENQENVVEILNAFRAQGVLLAIDDFGTGYSSLAYLKCFPLNVLKIDKSFIDDIPQLKDDMEITATIIAMGKILGFKVLAEGVETAEQLAFLEETGCDMYQGYIKSKPLPAEDFLQLLLAD
ncbi:MAG: EAL domain-containing protein [Methylococcales bacterium]|nr:EAL domain-containing protein [Methylococcales bacterium]